MGIPNFRFQIPKETVRTLYGNVIWNLECGIWNYSGGIL
jgi:hypothetical protein